MWPELCRIGPFTLHTYGALMAMAFLLAVGLAQHATRDPRQLRALDDAAIMDWAVWAMIGGILGGRLLYVASNLRVYLADPIEVFALWHGGLIWYGGLAGGIAATAWWLREHRKAFPPAADQLIPFVALGHAVGRIGCFANGCCDGAPTVAWWGITFPGSTQPVVPVQLLESAGLVLLYVILRAWQCPAVLQHPGRIFGGYLIGYGLIRWVVEGWRTNERLWLGWTLSQLISVGLILGGLVLLSRKRQAR